MTAMGSPQTETARRIGYVLWVAARALGHPTAHLPSVPFEAYLRSLLHAMLERPQLVDPAAYAIAFGLLNPTQETPHEPGMA